MTSTLLTLLSYLFIILVEGPLGIVSYKSSEFAQSSSKNQPINQIINHQQQNSELQLKVQTNYYFEIWGTMGEEDDSYSWREVGVSVIRSINAPGTQ
jgi:hypothetical protein